MFASGRDVFFVGASAGSGDGSMDGLMDGSRGKRSFASGRNESIFDGAGARSVDGLIVGSKDGSMEGSRGKETFTRVKNVSSFNGASVDSSDDPVDGSMECSRERRTVAGGRIESSFDGARAGSVDGSMDGLMNCSMDVSVASLFLLSGYFLFLISSASGRKLSSFMPTSMDGSGAVRFDGSIDGSDAGLFVRS